MKFHKLVAGISAGLLAAGGLVVMTALPASATPTEECVPSEAWIEDVPDITHPAVGTPTIIVENPDYVPAVDPIPATYGTEWKYTKHGGHGFLWLDNDTYKYAFADGTGTNTKPKGKNVVYYERTQHTREVELTPAIPGVPAQGEPTIEIENPDYVPEWVEITPDIEHPAVTCDAPGPDALYLSHVEYCGGVDITLRNVSRWIYPTSVKIDGVHSYGPTVDNRTDGKLNGPRKDQSKTRTITFPEDSGVHTVEYRIDAGTEADLYKGTPLNEWVTLEIDTDCEPNPEDEVTYGSWTTPEITCDSEVGDELTITREVSTVTYSLVDGQWVANEPVVTTEEDTYTVTAEDIEALDCPTPTPTPETTPEPEPTTTPLPMGGPDESEYDSLAVTGAGMNPWALTLGALATALGTMAVLFGIYSRRKAQDIES